MSGVHLLASPLVHHTPGPSSSCPLALCLLYGEEGGVPHLLTTRPDNEILPGTRQPARLHFNAFTFFLWKRTAYTSTNNSLVECEWGWVLYGRTSMAAQRWKLISWGLFPQFLTLLIIEVFQIKWLSINNTVQGKGVKDLIDQRGLNNSQVVSETTFSSLSADSMW